MNNIKKIIKSVSKIFFSPKPHFPFINDISKTAPQNKPPNKKKQNKIKKALLK